MVRVTAGLIFAQAVCYCARGVRLRHLNYALATLKVRHFERIPGVSIA